jgi:phosphohistidine phosphatase SixA
MIRRLLFCLVCALGLSTPLLAQSAIFVVRHAERADTIAGAAAMMATDPDLSEAGQARAASLASLLRDAGIREIYVTEYKRTQQTAAPLAKALGLTPIVITATDTAGLASRLKQATDPALVVGHSNSVPDLIAALGVATPVLVADTEFDHLFIVTPQSPPRVIQLRYR